MPKVIRTVIDEQGNVFTDFNGFVEGECLGEEERFRKDLAQLGLQIHAGSRKPKGPYSGSHATIVHKIS